MPAPPPARRYKYMNAFDRAMMHLDKVGWHWGGRAKRAGSGGLCKLNLNPNWEKGIRGRERCSR